MLGDVIAVRRDEVLGTTFLTIRSFNREFTHEVPAAKVLVLLRDESGKTRKIRLNEDQNLIGHQVLWVK